MQALSPSRSMSPIRSRGRAAAVLVWLCLCCGYAIAGEPQTLWPLNLIQQLRDESIQKAAAPSLVSYSFVPQVISAATTGTVAFAARTVGDAPTRLELVSQWGTVYPLADNGSNGDPVAGDGVYFAQIPMSEMLARLTPSDVSRVFVGFLDLYPGATRSARYNVFAQIKTNNIPNVSTRALSASAQVSRNIINLAAPAGYRNFNPSLPSISAITQAAYALLADQYDMLNVVFDRATIDNRYHSTAFNNNAGIGLANLDARAAFGSGGRLLGVNVFPSAVFFDGAEDAHSHEIGHQWIAFAKNSSLVGGAPHWPPSTMANGLMGFSIPGSGAGGNFSCDFSIEAGGLRTKPLPNLRTRYFNPLDLYLMGMLSPEEVPDQWIVTDNAFALDVSRLCDGRLLTSGYERLRIADVIAVNGARVPNHNASQRTFRVGTIVVSESLLSADAMSFYDYFAGRMENRALTDTSLGFAKVRSAPFFVATGGRGALVATTDPQANMVETASMVEYVNASFNYFFLTSRSSEQALLDATPGWSRTGASFPVLRNPAPGRSANIRFYFDQVAKNGARGSHFYTINPADLAALRALNPNNTSVPRLPVDEGVDSFAIVPNGSGAAATCASGTQPVYRVFRGQMRFPDDPNHRFTTNRALYDQLVAAGWDGEGVNFCVPLN